jgi:hypothetical protein
MSDITQRAKVQILIIIFTHAVLGTEEDQIEFSDMTYVFFSFHLSS